VNAPPPPGDVLGSRESSDHEPPLSAERKLLESKLQPSLLEAFDCAAKQQHDCKLVHDDKIEIEVWLAKNSASVIEQLRKLGLEPESDRASARGLVGKFPVARLELLAQMPEVRFVSNARR
jgi:hypothetical protein